MIVKYLLKVAMLGSTWVMYLLLALSVASIAVMVERWWFFRKRGTGGEEVCDALCDLPFPVRQLPKRMTFREHALIAHIARRAQQYGL